MLPAASAAQGEMTATRGNPYGRRSDELRYMPLGIIAFLPVELHIDYIAGSAKWDKHYEIIDTRQALALGSDIADRYIFKQRKFFSFSCHRTNFFTLI